MLKGICFWHHLNLEFIPYFQKDKLGEIVTSKDLNEQQYLYCQHLMISIYQHQDLQASVSVHGSR